MAEEKSMKAIKKAKTIKVENSTSLLSFSKEGGEYWKEWDRYLEIEKKKAYHIGNICDTCAFFFERMDGANQSIEIHENVENLRTGINDLNEKDIEAYSSILPDGEYVPILFEIEPKLIKPLSENDYFIKEQLDLWGIDSFYDLPHFTKTEYYRLKDKQINKNECVFNFLIPMYPSSWLKPDDIEKHASKIASGSKPTAISIGVLDIKQPADWRDDIETNKHWCFANYLLDGHHRTFAASKLKTCITLLSFLTIGKGVSTKEDNETIFDKLKE
jgi:hypothetical protein